MATLVQAKRQARIDMLIRVIVVGLVLYGLGVLTGPKVGALLDALTPPRLPPRVAVETQVWRDDQNWSRAVADEYHFKGQGTRTLPIPLSWLLALERPVNHVWQIPFAQRSRFVADDYLLRFGFIDAEPGEHNPHGLPIGLVATPGQPIDGLTGHRTAIGFTCAACHTGQLILDGRQYVIEGGPAMTDLGQLTLALGAALGQTLASSKLPLLDGRFERFARAVLGAQDADATRVQLEKELESVIEYLSERPAGIAVTEGFSRLDALNRIGNQVFAWDPRRDGNYVDVGAPVNYPHIWTASWFDWVQYDGSIMQPLVRNAGEAMGVAAYTDFTSPVGEGRLANAIPMHNLHWIESRLAGRTPPLAARAFSGLRAPTWPEAFPAIDGARAARGAELYEAHCRGCHLPALTRAVETGAAPDDPFWDHFAPIRWSEGGVERQTAAAVLRLKTIEQTHLGTDPAQGDILATRIVDTSGTDTASGTTPGIGIDAEICVLGLGEDGRRRLAMARIDDAGILPFAYALGAIVQQGIDLWFAENQIGVAQRAEIEGDRPNCLRAGAGYKARPLNGVWATAPFLHNGSVPTLMALLGPVEERPAAFLLGDPTFDPVDVGVVVRTADPDDGDHDHDYDRDGWFVLDTRVPGNHNTGHAFSDERSPGVIGPALTVEQRRDLVEFLKTL